jgi:hypothetical protein
MNNVPTINTKKCLICKDGQKNDCLHWHRDENTGDLWVYCVGVCQRGYSIHSYCYHAGIPLNEFLLQDFTFQEAQSNEVNKVEFPTWYVTLSDPRAKKGVQYVKSRGLKLEGDMYYDSDREGIVFPYYYDNTFVGAQTRFIEPRIWKDGTIQKIDTTPGTRTGLLFYGWNQMPFMANVKGVIITEGAFNAIAIQQSLNILYGSVATCPWRAIACSGSGATKHQTESIRELKENGFKIVVAPDSDEAGLKMLTKFSKAECITHYAFSGDSTKDWNDCLKEMGHEGFATWFLKQVKSVKS